MAKLNVEPGTVIVGDNLEVMRGINTASVDLIATDPPFNSKQEYKSPLNSEAAGAAFKDSWTWDDVDDLRFAELIGLYPEIKHVVNAIGVTHGSGSAAYAVMMGTRILEMHRILKPTGSLYLHCNQDANFMLRILLDFVFGADNFRNEIVWKYGLGGSSPHCWSQKHDTIFFYTKSDEWYFDKPKEPATSIRMAGQMKGMTAVWDIPTINNMAKERTGYKTQKPLPLYERIIRASSNEGDVVLDPFCGCGTTLIAAERLKRRWIGIDLGGKATRLVAKRLDYESQQGNLGSEVAPPSRRIVFADNPIHRTDMDEPLDGRAILQQAAATNW